jgi:hypothetical protein
MELVFKKYTLITYVDWVQNPDNGNNVPDNVRQYTAANESYRSEAQKNNETHPYCGFDFENQQVTRYWKTQEAAEAYKEVVLANAQKFNINIKSLEILDNTDWDPSKIVKV